MAYSPIPPLGQTTKSGSLPVAIASDQGNISVTFTQPSLVAGAALIGKVGIDQTTVGTTNGVALAQIGASATLTGNGVTGAGSQRVTIASDNAAFSVNATLQTGANVIGALTANQSVNNAQIAGVATATGNGVTGTGSQRVTVASDNTPFAVKIDQTTPGTTNAVNSTPVTPTPSNINSAASTNATSVKNAAGTLFGISCSNSGAAAAFVKLYNKASAPTVGTDTPVLTIPIPASGIVSVNLGTLGHRFTTGIALAITNLVADSDATTVAANQVKVMVDYV
jgi:hypothetical protein